MAGKHDDLKTYVTIDTAKILLEYATDGWQLCLEKIIELAVVKNNKLNEVLFDIDIGRVENFVKFWKNIPNKPQWLTIVCDDLQKILNGKTPNKSQQIKTNTEHLSLLIKKHFDKLNDIRNNL
jgi:hypothetical protein